MPGQRAWQAESRQIPAPLAPQAHSCRAQLAQHTRPGDILTGLLNAGENYRVSLGLEKPKLL